MEAHCYQHWAWESWLLVPLPPNRAERSLGALPPSAAVGRAPQEQGDAGSVTMATAAPGKPEVGVCGRTPPPCRCCLERRGLLGRLPTHSALSLDLRLYKGRTIPQGSLKGRRWTRRRGITISAHPHSCFPGQRGQRQGHGGTRTPSQLLPRGLPSWGPCTCGKGHPFPFSPTPPLSPWPALPEALLTTSSLTMATCPPHWTLAAPPFPNLALILPPPGRALAQWPWCPFCALGPPHLCLSSPQAWKHLGVLGTWPGAGSHKCLLMKNML